MFAECTCHDVGFVLSIFMSCDTLIMNLILVEGKLIVSDSQDRKENCLYSDCLIAFADNLQLATSFRVIDTFFSARG